MAFATSMFHPVCPADVFTFLCNADPYNRNAGFCLLDRESLRKNIIETWRRDYNMERPHSSLNDLKPVEFANTFKKEQQT